MHYSWLLTPSSTFFKILDALWALQFEFKVVQKIVLHLIVVPQLSSGQHHNYSTKTRQAGRANEQSMYSHVYGEYPNL